MVKCRSTLDHYLINTRLTLRLTCDRHSINISVGSVESWLIFADVLLSVDRYICVWVGRHGWLSADFRLSVNRDVDRVLIECQLSVNRHITADAFTGQEKNRSDCPGQVNFAPGSVKMEVWWSGWQVKLATVVLLVHFFLIKNLRLKDEQINELKAWTNLKSKHTVLIAFVLWCSLSLT